MTLRFASSLFVSAALLFFLEPIVAKMVLPLLGGVPAVWNTCMLFFQAVLLAGYIYAHASTRWLGVKAQSILQVALVLLPLLVLPIAFGEDMTTGWPRDENPALRLLWLLTVTVGLPFFVVSTTAPLLQTWFSTLGHEEAKDPYFLYVASNAGSMLALAGYPLVLEPLLGLKAQSRLWQVGYVGFVVLVVACAVTVWRHGQGSPLPASAAGPDASQEEEERHAPVTTGRRVRWTILAFVPSSLLLGVTSYISTDVASVPLLWVLPLALYLGTFILVFGKKPPRHALMVRLLPFAAVIAVGVILAEVNDLGPLLIVSHLATFFLASMVCHGALVRDRPSAAHLTEFYLWLSVGGVLGGLFNSLVAPFVFTDIVEYPLAIVLACICRAVGEPPRAPGEKRRDLLVPLGIGALTAGVALIERKLHLNQGFSFAAVFALPLFLTYASLGHPLRFALALGAILLASPIHQGILGRTVYRERNFFGVVRVTNDFAGRFTQITHGTTIHGVQSRDPERRREPLGYYHPTGPAGDVMEQFRALGENGRVAVIGLGGGAMACYARPGESWTYYEINPAVIRIAEDRSLFTYLSDAFPEGRGLTIALGDARLRLRDATDKSFGALVVDAFSSDSIPAHLVTREALRLYFAKIADHGLLALHVSNRYLRMRPMLADLAMDAGLVAYDRSDRVVSDEMLARGKFPSEWVVMARSDDDLARIAHGAGTAWEKHEGRPDRRVWTDDYSNLLGLLY